jgi:transcription antitermination factor NusG
VSDTATRRHGDTANVIAFPATSHQPPATALPWYVLHIIPCHEFRAAERLQERAIEYYLPSTKRKGFRGQLFDTPVFPGYVFARKRHIELYDAFRPTRWLLRVLGDSHGPITVAAQELESLRIVLATPKVVVLPPDKWKGGEEIEVRSGPLAGAHGTVAYVKNQHRLVVSVPMLGRCVSAELDADTVREIQKTALPKAA